VGDDGRHRGFFSSRFPFCSSNLYPPPPPRGIVVVLADTAQLGLQKAPSLAFSFLRFVVGPFKRSVSPLEKAPLACFSVPFLHVTSVAVLPSRFSGSRSILFSLIGPLKQTEFPFSLQ